MDDFLRANWSDVVVKQKQFLDVIDDAEATRRVRDLFASVAAAAMSEDVRLEDALGRVLFNDLRAQVDVPGFDRADMDGFAVRAADTFGAQELEPRRLRLRPESIAAGAHGLGSEFSLGEHEAISIATGGQLPRGANAILMIEDSAEVRDDPSQIEIFRPVAPGENLTGAGTDVGRDEIVLRRRQSLGSRETALAAAVGASKLPCFRRPRVAVISTGNEIKSPGTELAVGEIYDSNGRVLCDAVTECGGQAEFLGIFPDDLDRLREALRDAVASFDLVLMSGGTSKGAGDLNHRVIRELAGSLPRSAGVVVHGVALKPGKPICVAGLATTPVAVLPGFPTSAIFTFHEFVAPELRRLSGVAEAEVAYVEARVPMRLKSVAGRTEYMLVDLVDGEEGLAAYPLGRGSGSVSTFSAADGFIRIDRHTEFLEEEMRVPVRPLGDRVRRSDLCVIGSQCPILDHLLSELCREGFDVKSIAVGSQAGLRALARGEGDVAGTHLLDAETGIYNQSFLPEDSEILGGWGRRQGIVFRPGDERFQGIGLEEIAGRVHALGTVMVNRNRGSGTRVLLDAFLEREASSAVRPEGYHAQAKSHHAVAAAVAQGRADWGITLDWLAEAQGLQFVFLQEERFELAFRNGVADRPVLAALRAKLKASQACETKA